MSENSQSTFKPPYMAFQTFWNFIGDLSAHTLPPQIDRSMMASKSGTDQANLINTLKAFGLIDDEHRVLPGLTTLTDADTDARPALLADIVRRNYAAALEVADNNGTASQLEQCFRESYAVAGADTLRKSITFFLHAARVAGIPLSPHFKQTRAGSGAPGQPRKRAARPKPRNGISDPELAPATDPAIRDAYRLDVRLRTGGTMTLTVNVNPISLRGEDRTFFYDIVDKMTDYEYTDVPGQKGDSEEGVLDGT